MLVTSLIMGFFSIAILIAIERSINKSKNKNSGEIIFLGLVYVTIALIIFDIMGRFSGLTMDYYPVVNHIGNFLLFAFHPSCALLWLIYIYYQIYTDDKMARRQILISGILILFNIVMVILNLRFGFLYTIDENNMFNEGPLSYLVEIINIFSLVYTCLVIFLNKNRLSSKYIKTYIIVVILPILALLVQLIDRSYPAVVNSVALSIGIKYVSLQDDKISFDYLTGLFNRRQLDYYLEDKIKNAYKKESKFAALLVDLNDFKMINDKYGHHIGDEALKMTADIIRQSVSKSAFTARFGGDEFYIISDIDENDDVRYMIHNMESNFDAFNKKSDTFKLNPSVGYTVIDCEGDHTVESVQKVVDYNMYQNKIMSKIEFKEG